MDVKDFWTKFDQKWTELVNMNVTNVVMWFITQYTLEMILQPASQSQEIVDPKFPLNCDMLTTVLIRRFIVQNTQVMILQPQEIVDPKFPLNFHYYYQHY